MTNRETHENEERTVICPVEGCDAEKLARGMHLHVLHSKGDGHGPKGVLPDDVSLEDMLTVGTETVEMKYPTERDTEQEARLCPYCGEAFTGKQGVLIHLGQVAGRKNHPDDAAERHEPQDFPRVGVDEDENVIRLIEEDPEDADRAEGPTVPAERVYRYIAELLAKDKQGEAQRARRRLLETGGHEQPALLSPVFEPILAEARRREVGDGVTTALEDDGVYIEAGDRSPTLTADEARRLANELEQAAEHEDGLEDDLRGLIEWLRDCAHVLDGEMAEERLFIKHGHNRQ
ncbi:hypothetical protein KI372_03825 [Halobacterium salinarum]|uniref:hypothetical protein n=1 Tax=Halobacterium salinarum TaxID=2242 RepID=UPI001F353D48|nr:hypothetical protein [Halobacterium salinarum]MCF2207970.1 hypothetical protein [Halobacterium salinarum]MCF2240554.1 hypothetical protein [Halobacterium salinarum]